MLATILLTSFVLVTVAQDSEESSEPKLIAVSTNKLEFVGEKGVSSLERTLKVVAFGAETVSVNLFPADLYENSTGALISHTRIEISNDSFTLSRNSEKLITITIDTTEIGKGNYQGTILVTATDLTNTTNTTSITIDVTANIKVTEDPNPYYQYGLLVVISVVLYLSLCIPGIFDEHAKDQYNIGIPKTKKLRVSKELLKLLAVVFTGVIAVSIWVYIILTKGFGKWEDLIYSTLTTVVFTPIFGYVIKYVDDRRKERDAEESSARKILEEGLNKDIEMIRSAVGEMTEHFVSFQPDFEDEEFPKTPEILYNESGELDTKYWEENIKQGLATDLPILHVDKYYEFIPLYNKYYKHVLTFRKKNAFKELPHDFLSTFENFRANYAELETVIFVYLSYYLGLFGKKVLSPFTVEYPRITRILLKKLIDYKVLDAELVLEKAAMKEASFQKRYDKKYKKYPDRLENTIYWEEFGNEIDEIITEKDKKLLQTEIEKWAKEKTESGKDLQEKIRNWKIANTLQTVTTKAKLDQNALDKKMKKWKEKNRRKEWAKESVNDWLLGAGKLDKIVKIIYQRDNVRKFFDEVGKDFKEKYRELKESITYLKPLPELDEKYQTKENIAKLKKEAETLKELKENRAIDSDVYEKRMKEIQTKITKLYYPQTDKKPPTKKPKKPSKSRKKTAKP